MPRRKKKSTAMLNRANKLQQRVRRRALVGEERAQWLARHAEYQRERRARMPPEKLEQIRRTNAERNRRRRAALSPEGLEQQRRANRERARRRRDFIRTGLLPDSAACPDFFSSVGLRPERLSPASDREHDLAEKDGKQRSGPDGQHRASDGFSELRNKRGRLRKSDRSLRNSEGNMGKAVETDLLNIVSVELIEEHSETETEVQRTVT